jgi:hypothetical protein
MTAPVPTGGQPHVIQPPPQDDPTTARIVDVLLAAATIEAAAAGIAVILRPVRIGLDAIVAALRLSDAGTNHQPRPRGYGQVARDQALQEAYLRAAYVARAAWRIQSDLNAGRTLAEARQRERRYQQAHEKARRARQEAAKRVLEQARAYGPVLGWYLNPMLSNEAECIAANGNNFRVATPPAIGYPGMVHPGCGCYPGPPWLGGGWVDAAVAAHVEFGKAKKLVPLKKAS